MGSLFAVLFAAYDCYFLTFKLCFYKQLPKSSITLNFRHQTLNFFANKGTPK